MSVRCTGDSRLLEQVGEKREFECALSARGLPHEEFELHVRRIRRRPFGEAWSCDYAITVSRTDGGVRHVYAGGPAYRWVERFAEHLADGKYGLGARVTGLLMARRRARGNGRRSFAHTE